MSCEEKTLLRAILAKITELQESGRLPLLPDNQELSNLYYWWNPATRKIEAVEITFPTIPVHNDLDGLQGGQEGERFHFSESQHEDLIELITISPEIEVTISAGNSRLLGSSNLVDLLWEVTKHTKGISNITISGESITPNSSVNDDADTDGNTQLATKNTTATQNVNTTFNSSVTAGTRTVSTSVTLTWMPYRYWGKINVDGLGNALDSNDALALAQLIANPPTDIQIKALTGAGIGIGKELSNNRVKSFDGIDCAGEFFLYGYRSSLGAASFKVNGLTNTAFTLLRNNNLTNEAGYTTTFRLYCSNSRNPIPIPDFDSI